MITAEQAAKQSEENTPVDGALRYVELAINSAIRHGARHICFDLMKYGVPIRSVVRTNLTYVLQDLGYQVEQCSGVGPNGTRSYLKISW